MSFILKENFNQKRYALNFGTEIALNELKYRNFISYFLLFKRYFFS